MQNYHIAVKDSRVQYNVYILLFISDTDCCTRMCCGPGRPFDMKIFDNSQREVIHLNRPLRCSACCFPCCLQEIEVTSPPGTPVGYIAQKYDNSKSQFIKYLYFTQTINYKCYSAETLLNLLQFSCIFFQSEILIYYVYSIFILYLFMQTY